MRRAAFVSVVFVLLGFVPLGAGQSDAQYLEAEAGPQISQEMFVLACAAVVLVFGLGGWAVARSLAATRVRNAGRTTPDEQRALAIQEQLLAEVPR